MVSWKRPSAAPTNLPQQCRSHQDDWYDRVIPDLHPDIIVLIHRPFDAPIESDAVRVPGGRVIASHSGAFEPALRAAANASIDALRAPGRKIVVIEPIPLAPSGFNPFTCLSKARYLEQCRYVASAVPSPLERFYRSVANGTSIYSLDIDRLVCPYLPICDPIVNGQVVKHDSQHLTAGYSKTLATPIAAVLAADGIVPHGP